jgi:hypothetical protein
VEVETWELKRRVDILCRVDQKVANRGYIVMARPLISFYRDGGASSVMLADLEVWILRHVLVATETR